VSRLTLAGPLQMVAAEKVRVMLLTLDKPQGASKEPGRFPEIGFCEAKQKLVYDFLEAVREMNLLQEQQARAAIEDDQDFSRFDVLLHFAQEKKDLAKYAWIAHVDSHGCS
jgi:hypothetical protein